MPPAPLTPCSPGRDGGRGAISDGRGVRGGGRAADLPPRELPVRPCRHGPPRAPPRGPLALSARGARGGDTPPFMDQSPGAPRLLTGGHGTEAQPPLVIQCSAGGVH